MDEATPRRPYHHGDLQEALVGAGYDLALKHGPDAVTLRAVTRRAGVSATAAYRHFEGLDELRFAIGLRALQAMAATIEAHQSRVEAPPGLAHARALLEAVGNGYIAFALANPNAFRIGLYGLLGMQHAERPEGAATTGRTPFQLLTDALAGLTELGALSAEGVQPAAIHCWSSVHGFASLAILGPLRSESRERQDALAVRLVRDVVDGLLAADSRTQAYLGEANLT